jgi:prepilin-type N-terminal cleavage/methylation domain-containing protein
MIIKAYIHQSIIFYYPAVVKPSVGPALAGLLRIAAVGALLFSATALRRNLPGFADKCIFSHKNDIIDRMCGGRLLDQRGVTLMELVTVLAMIGIAAAIAIPFYLKMQPHVELKNAAGDIASDMMTSRMRAISEDKDFTIQIDLAGDTYVVIPEGGGASDEKGRQWKAVDLYSDGSDAQVPPLSGGNVDFRPNGTASVSGYEAVYLRNDPPRAERYRVRILGATGKVSVEKWKGGSWATAY